MPPDLSQHRLLLVFAPSAQDPRYLRQERAMRSETKGMKERDLLRIVVFPASATADGRVDKRFVPANLRRRYGVGEGRFRVLLVGKDGGVKRVDKGPVAMREIFALIDTMPMRQAEMRRPG